MKDIKLTNFEVMSIVNLLNRTDSIINSDKSYPIKVLWAIDENFRKLNDIFVNGSKMAQKIVDKYNNDEYFVDGTDENGQTVKKLKPEAVIARNKDFFELDNIVNELSISTILYEDIEKFEITGKDFQSIRFMIEKPNYDEVKE